MHTLPACLPCACRRNHLRPRAPQLPPAIALQELVGGSTVFEPFFKAYIQRFKDMPLNSDDFKARLWRLC